MHFVELGFWAAETREIMNGNGAKEPFAVTDKLVQYRVLDTTLMGLLVCVRSAMRAGATAEEAIEETLASFRRGLTEITALGRHEDLAALGVELERSRPERALEAVLEEGGFAPVPEGVFDD